MSRKLSWTQLAGTVIAAGLLWFFTFHVAWGNVWVKIALSSALLCGAAFVLGRDRMDWEFRPTDIPLALGAAAVLYLVFYLGDAVSALLFDFAPDQVGGIYARGEGTQRWVICLLLLCVTSPAEEIYWRGFLQEDLGRKLGPPAGWAVATSLYALVHLPAWNFMLIGAAAVAGAFWGLLYWKVRRVWPLIICHAAWSVTIFALVPIRGVGSWELGVVSC
jgi:hypothetical protein